MDRFIKKVFFLLLTVMFALAAAACGKLAEQTPGISTDAGNTPVATALNDRFSPTSAATAAQSLPSNNAVPSNDVAQCRKIYTQYLLNGGYEALLEDGFADQDLLEISTCLVDINDDGAFELLLSITNTEFSGPRGYPTNTFMLCIQAMEVKMLASGYYSGGTMGGESLEFRYDGQRNEHVLVADGLYRNGTMQYGAFLKVYGYADGEMTVCMTIAENYLSTDSAFSLFGEEADAIRKVTDLYDEEDGDFYYYKIDNNYVTKEEYTAACERFNTPTDGAYQLQPGTYENPIP